ncbi:hypothetical protein [Amycolatopsis acidicola]|uniref:hypothetical protein n=1 Tax=Amycolatopsis acidicola TaxID=2596893 RepID=UPI001AA05398|nr:hypothetical protein [Amycolatopsis acidicola]
MNHRDTSHVPAIPTALAHRPTTGGLVVPWITPQTADGRFLLGSIDERLARRALLERRCGVCGTKLHDRVVLLMRLSDLPQRASVEPALHPQCAAYTISACPMVAGRLSTYRATLPRHDENMKPAADNDNRLGAAAEPWFSVWLRDYRLSSVHGNLAAAYVGQPLRIRPIALALLGIAGTGALESGPSGRDDAL